MEETKVFWVAAPYDSSKDEIDEFLHDEIQNSILDYLEEIGIDPETADLVELTPDEYKNFTLMEGELLFVYGPLPVSQHDKDHTYIPSRISFDVMFMYETGVTVLDNEHPADGWKLRCMNDDEIDEMVNNL